MELSCALLQWCAVLVSLSHAWGIFNNFSSPLSSLEQYIKKYELSRMEVSEGSGQATKFRLLRRAVPRDDIVRVRVQFRSFGLYFDFVATRNRRAEAAFFEKRRAPTVRNSVDAMGYVTDGVFTGLVTLGNTTYYVEPASHYWPNRSGSQNAIVYRDVDVRLPPNLGMIARGPLRWNSKNHTKNTRRRRDNDHSDVLEVTCQLEMVADHTLFQMLGSSVRDTVGFLYLHAKFADSVFRKSKFGSRVVRIALQNVEVLKEKQYPEVADVIDLLYMYAHRVQYYCVSMLVCNKRFKTEAIGVSFTADMLGMNIGGVCQEPLAGPLYPYRSFTRSYNTGVVSVMTKNGMRLPLAVTTRSVTHELGHAFGSEHDPPEDVVCTPGGKVGYYIMFDTAQMTGSHLSDEFSPCSIKAIASVVTDRSCLKPAAAICGNGVQEDDEECDCGHPDSCDVVDPCCTPRGGVGGTDLECTFRRSRGSQCSPKENTCCTTECTIVSQAEEQLCFSAGCHQSFCDGSSGRCPFPTKSPDGTPCLGMSRTCRRGACNSTVCMDNAMADCTCSKLTLSCLVCCSGSKGDRCRPAYDFGFRTVDGDALLRRVGSSCYSRPGYTCDISGRCILPTYKRISRVSDDSSSSSKMVAFFTLAGVLCVFGIVFAILYYRWRSSRWLRRLHLSLRNIRQPPTAYTIESHDWETTNSSVAPHNRR